MPSIDIQVFLDPPAWQVPCANGLSVRVQDVVFQKGDMRARVQVSCGTELVMTDRISLTSSRARTQFLKRLLDKHQTTLDERVLTALEEKVRQDLPNGRSPKPFEQSNPSSEVILTPEVEELLHDANLLGRISSAMHQRGYVGDTRPPTLTYIALTSRLLHKPDKPMNLALVAQSASGKNRTVDAALELIPEEAVCTIRASSERAIIYLDEDFQHRVIFFSEADSIPDEGPAASAIRSLASDYVLAYDVPEQNPDTKRWETRRIEKPGPTGLITTSTKSLAHQLGTRVLEVPLKDDPEQTRAVMKAHAKVVSGGVATVVSDSVESFVGMQRWLGVHGEHRVRVPFADVLATVVPSQAVRMRRDFQQLLTCVQVIAFLHQRQRSLAEDGAVIATLEDYGAARDLLAPIFDTIATEGVTRPIRDTVEAVPEIGNGISQKDLANALKLATSTVSWRVKRALKDGWLKNMEKREGHPMQLMRGTPLPDEACALPTVDQVRGQFDSLELELSPAFAMVSGEAFECSNDFRVGPEDMVRWDADPDPEDD